MLEVLTGYPNVENAHIVHVSTDDYYALRFEASSIVGGALDLSAIMPLEQEGPGNFVNIGRITFYFACEETGTCNEICTPDGPTWSTDTWDPPNCGGCEGVPDDCEAVLEKEKIWDMDGNPWNLYNDFEPSF